MKIVRDITVDYMFNDEIETLHMVEGAYKKFKCNIYYDKTMLWLKDKIAFFESDRKSFNKSLKEITYALGFQDKKYFDSLIKQIHFKIMPKTFAPEDSKVKSISTVTDHKKKLETINYFIDMPIELYIIDYLWLLLIGKIAVDNNKISLNACATKFKNSLYLKHDNSLITGIDYDSYRSFTPYYSLYKSWKDTAFSTINKYHDNNNLILVNLDIKGFYYSVRFDFNNLYNYLDNDPRLEGFIFLTESVKKIYISYTRKITKYTILPNLNKDCSILPIGLPSTNILREFYLNKFDSRINTELNPLYYGRYVDDILLVLKDKAKPQTTLSGIIKEYFIDKNIITGEKPNYRITDYELILQEKKINIFTIPQNQRTILLDIYEDFIKKNNSEYNLLPDINLARTSFTKNSYVIQNLDISNKIRDLGFLQSSNYKVSTYLHGLLRSIKNTYPAITEMENFFEDIVEFYSGSQCLEFSQTWRPVFELFVMTNNKNINCLVDNILKEIDKINFKKLCEGEVTPEKNIKCLSLLKKSLNDKLKTALALAIALNPSQKILTDNHKFNIKDIIYLAKKLRTSNLINDSLVAYPLINYVKNESFSLIEPDLDTIITKIKKPFK